MKTIRVGIVGAGEVTQVIHLPTLDLLADLFTPTAICDTSTAVAQAVGRRWRVPVRLSDYRDLVALPDIDAVLVACTETFHTEVTLAALEAGKHVLLEKPMCYSPREADAIVEAQRRARRVVQVGYMRRYNPAFVAACERVRDLLTAGDVRLARVHDVIGANTLIVGQIARVTRPDDLDQRDRAGLAARRAAQIEEAIGPAPPDHHAAFSLLHGLASHDLSAMREMLGPPKGVLYAARRHGGRSVSAAFDYGEFVCHLEVGVDSLPRYDTHIEVFGSREVVRVTFDTPYVRSLPVTATVTEATGGPDAVDGPGVARRDLHPGWEDQYALEWRAFARHIAEGSEPKASASDARRDVELILELYRASLAAAGALPGNGASTAPRPDARAVVG
ncbi:MAG TPA: Gfo/Idh/MocA family oxidoreductase [Chloroflexota bacterium]|nr:Gfo/Idh/MocA family oxidoreductase [Chloroflexota bacterium]